MQCGLQELCADLAQSQMCSAPEPIDLGHVACTHGTKKQQRKGPCYLQHPIWQRNLCIVPNIASACMEAHDSLDAQTFSFDHGEELLIA